jgi:3'-phosphoadenosine 5'-phosphosulfate sulfotransferase (PAPS reductase)/FAD synthetase
MTHLSDLVAKAHEDIAGALRVSKKPLIAYSGGKDGLVAAHLMAQHGATNGVCETSFYYATQEADVRQTAARLGLNVSFQENRDDDWLRKHPEFLFADDAPTRSKSFAGRQQRTMRINAEKQGADMVVFGRRTEENSVKTMLYPVHGRLSFHPIRDWRETDVWAYLASVGIERPWIYSTVHGTHSGNSPFYSLRARLVGGQAAAWAIATSLDPTITQARYLGK